MRLVGFGAEAAVAVGWLYLRNYLTSGDPFGLAIHAIGDQSPLRLSQSALANFAQHLGDLEITTWFASGWAELVPAPLWLLTTYRLIYGNKRAPARTYDLPGISGYLTGKNFYIAAPTQPEPMTIVKRPRVGVDYAGHWARRHLRFYIKGNPFVSKR